MPNGFLAFFISSSKRPRAIFQALSLLIGTPQSPLPLCSGALATTWSLVAGTMVHAPAIKATQREMQDAITRAQAWIGARAPAEFRRNLQFVSLLEIQAGTIYRACVPNHAATKSFCVIVNRQLPFERSVTFSGYEPNSVLGAGTQ